jgi:transposase
LALLAESLMPSDRVALEVTGSCWEVARILEPHVERVVVVSPDDTGITQARAKTDRLDARALARLLWLGELESVWMPDERCRVLRRRLARREQLVHARSRSKNEIHAVLQRRLQGKPPCSDLFGIKGRRWLAGLELPLEERESVDAGIRQIEFLDGEIAAVERLIAHDALGSAQIKRLMSVPGVNVIVAASFLAAIGDIGRFENPRKLVGYLGLDPRVRQSGPGPATHGHISKQGSVRARHALVEACWTAVRQPGPLHAFYERIRARRGHSVAVVAAARKLACLFWCLLTRETDYAYAQPSLTKKKLRRLELTAGHPRYTPEATGIWHANDTVRQAERELARQAEVAYQRTVRDYHATKPQRRARARHRDAHLKAVRAASSAARHRSQTLRFSSSSPAPTTRCSGAVRRASSGASEACPRDRRHPLNNAREAAA